MTAVEPETFDLSAALNGTSYPAKTMPMYLNIKAVAEYHDLEDEAALLGVDDTERNDEILAEQKELREKILNSMLNIELIGVPRSVIKAITKKAEATTKDKSEVSDVIDRALLLRSVTQITNRAGQVAEVTEEGVDLLLSKMTKEVYDELVKTMWELSFDSMRYESTVTDPIFS